MQTLIQLLVSGIAVFVSARILPGIRIDSFLTAIVVAVVLGLVNILVKPILFLLTLPVTIVTFGLFALVLNALMILLVDALVPGFEVRGFWWALLFSLVLALVGSLINSLAK